MGSCSVFRGAPTGYSSACSTGTEVDSSATKVYTFTIDRVDSNDTTDWWCAIEGISTRSNNFSLTVASISLVISGSSQIGFWNEIFTLTCTATDAANAVYSLTFNRANVNSAVTLVNQNRGSCNVFQNAPTGYSSSCSTGTDVSSSSTKKYTLTINRVNSRDITDWWCAIDGTSTRSNNFRLTVVEGPDSVIVNPPSPEPVREGDSLTVMCNAGCIPPCNFKWTLGSQQVSSTSVLTLRNINRSQTGRVYTCTATNTVTHKSKNKTFTLTVYYGPDCVELNSSSPLTVQEGDNVAVSCETTKCSPACSVSWKFKSVITPASPVLTINNIKRSSAGNYTCTARNTKTQKSLHKKITVDVQYQSSITSLTLNSQSSVVTADELTAMTLGCNVDSNPGSDIKLLNNSQTLRHVTNSRQAEYTWNEAGCLDTGKYTCEADNGIKSAVSKRVQLVVRCSPRLDHRVPFQREFGAGLGDNVTMEISVIANPRPTFTWYRGTDRNRAKLGSGSSSYTDVSAVGKLTLTNVQEKDIGTYQVVVSNGNPRADLMMNFSLKVAGPPNIPSDVIVWSDSPHSVSVSWIEESDGGAEQTFLIQYRQDTSTQWINNTEEFQEEGFNTNHTATIPNLKSKTRYLVRIVAYNKYGYKGFTKEQEALPLEESASKTENLLGSGIGIGIGIMLGIIILVGGIILTYKLIRKAKAEPEHVYATRESNSQRVVYEDLQQTRGDETTETSVSSNYSSLGTRNDTPYDVFNVYENAGQIK